MNSRTLVTLLAVLATLAALAIAVSMSQQPAGPAGDALVAGLKDQLNDVTRIVVKAGGDRTVATLERREGGWVVLERDAYPADVGRIRRNLIALAEATLLEEKTSNPEFHDRLKVEDIEKEGAGGLRLDIGIGEQVTGVIIGATGVGGGERAYARRPGEATSWLVGGDFDLPQDTGDWLDKLIVDLPAARVQAVTVTQPDGAVLRIEKAGPEAGEFQVRGVPAGRELSFPGVGNAIGSALAGLELDGVEPAAGFAPGDVQPVTARFETFDGLVVEAQAYRLPTGLKLRLAATADAALAERFAAVGATQAPAGESADKAANNGTATTPRKSVEAVQAEAQALQARLAGWVYSVPGYKSEQLSKRMEDLLVSKLAGPPKPF
ncbi:MAG: DUF4340 domain-containing protein [Gammaproteobacteria bacterium]|nr:DUF4340 domain-containing protein [Gammaproteobacteria bacterium]